jgi:hypothetical protein
VSAWKSALPGDPNVAMIQRVIIDINGPKIVRLQMPPDPHRSTQCDDISCDGGWDDVYWSPDSKTLGFVSTSRDHKEEDLRVADAATGAVRDVYKERTATQFESGQGAVNWRYLPTTNEFIWLPSDGWGHLYLYNLANGTLKQITKAIGPSGVLDVDEANRVIFFEGGGRGPATIRISAIYTVSNLTVPVCSCTPENANHDVTLSPDGKYFTDNYSTPDTLPFPSFAT